MTVHKTHNRWLILIAAFKLLQALLFAAVGVGAFRLVGQNVGDILQYLVHSLHFNPESEFVDLLMEKASSLTDPLLQQIGIVTFIYAALDTAEGIGLYLEKIWAEYLTLLITASFLPLEVYEILRRVTWMRVGLLTVNLLVFLYLFKLIFARKRSLTQSDPE